MNSLNEEGDEYMETKYQVVALVGRSGVGKEYLIKATCEKHPTVFNKIINCTTRPCRETELENPPYIFLSLENFTRKVLAGNMLEATEFNNWFYSFKFFIHGSSISNKYYVGNFLFNCGNLGNERL